MYRTLAAVLFAVSMLSAQPAGSSPLSVEILTEAASCEIAGAQSVCLHYAAPATAESPGAFEPGGAALKLAGLDGQPVTVSVSIASPLGRQWLGVRGIGGSEMSSSVAGVLPLGFEISADESQLRDVPSGRYIAMLIVSLPAASISLRIPVEIGVTAETDALQVMPDVVADISVVAGAAAQPLRFPIDVSRNQTEPPLHVSVTPESSDGGTWLSANLQGPGRQCATEPAPCVFEAVVSPPARPGTYWGVLVVAGDGYGERVTVRLTVTPAPQAEPISIVPRQVTLSAPFGSQAAVWARVAVSGGNRDGVSYRAVYNDPWLAVDPPTGTWPMTLRVIMSPLGLEPGVYTDIVTLRSTSTNEVLAAIPVRFNVIAPAYAPAVLDGGGWQTRLFLVNPSLVEAKATVRFWSAGSPWVMGLENRGLAAGIENEVIPPGGLRVVATQGASSRLQQGWAELIADGPVTMHTVFAESRQVSRLMPVETTIPMMNPYRDALLLAFDNTAGVSSSVSLANADDEPVSVGVRVLNENGAEVAHEGKLMLAAREGATYALAERWPSTAGRQGLIALHYDGGRLFALGLRSRSNSFYSYPAVACAEMGVDRALPNVAVGGDWQSTAYLANTSTQSQWGLLRLWPDKARQAGSLGLGDESAPVVPSNGITLWQAQCKDYSKTSGGWLESRYTKQVNGFLMLRQNYTGSLAPGTIVRYEAALAGQRSLTGRIAIPYDNRAGNNTRIVLVNPSATPTDVQPILYDLAGRFPRFGDALRIPARGQLLIEAGEKWELGPTQGTIEFSSRQGVALTGVGLRFGDGPLTILPAYEK